MPNGKEGKILKQFVAKTETDSDERTVTAIISTGTVDREKEVLVPKGMDFEAYMKNPVVMWAHDYWGEPIGRSLWMKKGRKEIKAKIKFAETEQAEQVYQLFKGGFMSAFSVGFIPLKDHKPTEEEIKEKPEWVDVRRVYDKWELLEFSAVPVPANPEALAVAVKTKELNLSDELKDQLDVDDSVTVYAGTGTDTNPPEEVGKEIDELEVDPEPTKIKVYRRPKLRKHCIMKRGYDPNEIRAMAEAQVRGEVYFEK